MTDEDYRALLRQAAAAYREVRPWVTETDTDRWHDMVVSLDEERERVTGRGILIQNMSPDDFGGFMKAWMRAQLNGSTDLRWIVTPLRNAAGDYDLNDGILLDEGHSVGRVHLEPLYHDRERGEDWHWSMYALSGFAPKEKSSGRAASKEEAKRLVEQFYDRFCSHLGARDDWQRHMRELEERKASVKGKGYG